MPGREQGDAGTDEADGGADQVVTGGLKSVRDDSPGEGTGHKDASIGGQHAIEVRVGPRSRGEPVGGRGYDTARRQPARPLLRQGLPDQLVAVGLGHGGDQEKIR